MIMRTIISLWVLSGISLCACPDLDKAASKYIAENFSTDEEKPMTIEHRSTRIQAQVGTVQVMVPDADEGKTAPQPVTLFFAGKARCEFVLQAEGEITETLEAGNTRYVFVRHESREDEERYVNYQVLRIAATGEVEAARDQHGQEIFLEEALQKRCGGKVGNLTLWSRDNSDAQKIILRQRHTERDGKCRVIEDTSSYRYYHLTPERWELDDGETDAAMTDTEDAPATAPVPPIRRPVSHKR
jgi:hypothetical protein